MKKILFLAFLFFFSTKNVAQEPYKFLIIPSKFDFLKTENQYNLNTLCKLFMEKEGFIVYMDNAILPTQIANNRCNVLFLNLVEENNVFTTKIKVELKDCQNKIILISELGTSREKDYLKAYTSSTKTALNSLIGKLDIKNEFSSNELITATAKKEEVKEKAISNIENSQKLIKLETSYGFNLVTEKQNVIYELYNTSDKNVFIAKKENSNGVFMLKDNQWLFEYYQDEKLVSEKVEVKF